MDSDAHIPPGSNLSFGRLWVKGWWKKATAAFVIIILGVAVWSQRINSAQGFLLDDPNHLRNYYQDGFRIYPGRYLPGVIAHRPIGRDALTILFTLFGENEIAIIWALLGLHILSSVLIWLMLYRLTSNWWGSLAGATFFLLNTSAYLVIYWPAAVFDLLSTFFLACLLLSVAHIVQPEGEYRPGLLMLTTPFLLAAVKTKESAIVAIVPLLLMVIFAKPRRKQIGNSRSNSPAGGTIERVRNLSSREVAWAVLNIALVIILSLTVSSDIREASSPQHPYYTEYSYQTLGRSFGYYLATLIFRPDDAYPLEPYAAWVLLLVPLMAAVLFKNRWMLLGWSWFVIFLLPVAALKNHYAFSYYPYAANIGTALFTAGFFNQIEILWNKWKTPRPLRCALPVIFIALLTQQSYLWIRNSAVPKWYENIHARRARMVAALKEVLPRPPQNAEIVLVYPGVPLDQDISSLLRVIYHDNTLVGAFFTKQQEAENYLATRQFNEVYLATWIGETFELRRLTDD